MSDCRKCVDLDWCAEYEDCDLFRPKKMTNADRLRAMSDEELAKKMSGLESFALTCGGGWPPEKWLDWLKSPVEPGEVENG